MAINPDNITTVRVGQLPDEPFNLTDKLPHEVGTDLKQGTVQSLADFLSSYLSVSGSVGFKAVTVNDGDTLPATTQQEFILVGKGTFQNVGGGSPITTTEELNALVSNGTFWFIGVEIPIEFEGVTQFIRQGFLGTAPSEDAVYNALASLTPEGIELKEDKANKQDNLNYDGTGVFYPTVDAVNNLSKNIATVCTKTGLLSKNDTFNFIAFSNTVLRITAVTSAIFWNELSVPGNAPSDAIKSFPQKDYDLSELETATGGNVNINPITTDGKHVRYVGYDVSGNIYTSATTFLTNYDILQLGLVTVLRVGASITFLDGTVGPRNIFAQPNIAANTDFDKVSPFITDITISANSGASFATSNGNITGICANWKSAINPTNANPIDVFPYTGVNPAVFRSIDPTFLTSTAALGTHTLWTELEGGIAINNSFYNTTLSARGTMANGSASLKRILVGVRGSIYVQDAEFPTTACYADFNTAKNNIFNHTFSDPIQPEGLAFEIARVAYIKGATSFTDTTQFYIVNTSSGSGGGVVPSGEGGGGAPVIKTRKDVSGSYTLLSTDVDKILYLAAGTILTVPSGLTINQDYEVIQWGAGTSTFITSGTTFKMVDYATASTYGQNGRVMISYVDTETYSLFGDLALI